MKACFPYYTLLLALLFGRTIYTIGLIPRSVKTFLVKYANEQQERDTGEVYRLVFNWGVYQETDSVGRRAEQRPRRIRYGGKFDRAQVPQTVHALIVYLNSHTSTDSNYVRAASRTV